MNISANLNPLNAELNPICHLLAFLGAHHIFHVSGLRVKLLCRTYTYGYIVIFLHNSGQMFSQVFCAFALSFKEASGVEYIAQEGRLSVNSSVSLFMKTGSEICTLTF